MDKREYAEARRAFLAGDEQCPDCGAALEDGCGHVPRQRRRAPAAEVTVGLVCFCGRLRSRHAGGGPECDTVEAPRA